VPDWRIKHQWRAPNEVWSLALSPDGEPLAAAGWDDGIALWSMTTGEQIRTLTGKSSLISDGTSLAWLPDGRLISGGDQGQVGIWDPATWEEQLLPRIHTDQVNSVAVSPNGDWIATGSSDKTIVLWDATGRPLRRLRGHRNLVQGLTFDPSGQRLLSTSDDNDLRLWDLASGTTLRVFQGHVAGLWSVIVAMVGPTPPPTTAPSAAGSWIVPASGFGTWIIRNRSPPVCCRTRRAARPAIC